MSRRGKGKERKRGRRGKGGEGNEGRRGGEGREGEGRGKNERGRGEERDTRREKRREIAFTISKVFINAHTVILRTRGDVKGNLSYLSLFSLLFCNMYILNISIIYTHCMFELEEKKNSFD